MSDVHRSHNTLTDSDGLSFGVCGCADLRMCTGTKTEKGLQKGKSVVLELSDLGDDAISVILRRLFVGGYFSIQATSNQFLRHARTLLYWNVGLSRLVVLRPGTVVGSLLKATPGEKMEVDLRNDLNIISRICLCAFSDLNLSTLSLCPTLKTIDKFAFVISRLTTLDFSKCNLLETIDYGAFYRSKITDLNFNSCKALSKIGYGAFHDSELRTLELSGCCKLEYIGGGAFYNSKLRTLDLSGCRKLEYIGGRAFRASRLTELDLSKCNLLDTIDDEAFYRSKITVLNLDECKALSKIGTEAFYNSELRTLNLSGCCSLKSIGDRAFFHSAITKISLSPSLELIGKGAFESSPLTDHSHQKLDLSNIKCIRDSAFFFGSENTCILPRQR